MSKRVCPACGQTDSTAIARVCWCCNKPLPELKNPNEPTFIAEKSDAKFALTPQEEAHLNNLLVWQEQSAKSVMMIGGDQEIVLHKPESSV